MIIKRLINKIAIKILDIAISIDEKINPGTNTSKPLIECANDEHVKIVLKRVMFIADNSFINRQTIQKLIARFLRNKPVCEIKFPDFVSDGISSIERHRLCKSIEMWPDGRIVDRERYVIINEDGKMFHVALPDELSFMTEIKFPYAPPYEPVFYIHAVTAGANLVTYGYYEVGRGWKYLEKPVTIW